MRIEDKKYVWWGLLGIGVAAFFYFLSTRNKGASATNVAVPYLVPKTTGASPTADTSLSDQQNIIGSSSQNQVPNFSNPYAVSANYAEAPGTWGFMPQLIKGPSVAPANSVAWGQFEQPVGAINFQNGLSLPGANYPTWTMWTPGSNNTGV